MNFILKVAPDLSLISVQQPTAEESQVNHNVLRKITGCVQVITVPVIRHFSKGQLEQLSGIKVPKFIYYIDNTTGRLQIVIYDFEGFGADIIHPVTGDLMITLKYSESKVIPYPLHEPVDAVNIQVNDDETVVNIEFKFDKAGVSYQHTNKEISVNYFDVRRLIASLGSAKC